jgi:hypothetical protein
MLSRYHVSRSGEQDRLGAAGNDVEETKWILRVLLCLLVMAGNHLVIFYGSCQARAWDQSARSLSGPIWPYRGEGSGLLSAAKWKWDPR